MAENQQSPPSLEELRAAKAALEKKATPPSLEQFRAAKAAQSSKKAPEIPPVEEPTEARPPFAEPSAPPELTESLARGEGGLGVYSPAVAKQEALRQVSPPLAAPSISEPKPPAEVDLQSVLRPKPVGTEAAPAAIKAPSLLPEEKRKEYNYYEDNYAKLNSAELEKRKKEVAASSDQFNRMQQFLEANNQGLAARQNQILEKARQAESAKESNPLLYNQLAQELETEQKSFDREYRLLELNAELVSDFARKTQLDQDAVVRREHDIKAGIGSRPAGMAYSILSGAGKVMSGLAQMQEDFLPDPGMWIMETFGEKPEGFDEQVKQMKGRLYENLRIAPVKFTGIEKIVTPEYIEKRKKESLFDAGLFTLSEMAPAVAASVVGGTPAMAGAFFASSYDDMGQEMQGEYWNQIPEAEKKAIQIGVSVVSAGLSTMGLQALAGRLPIVNDIFFKAAQKILPNMTAGQVRRIIDAETKSYVTNLISKSAQGILIEGPEEGIDYLSEEAVKHFYEEYKRSQFGDKADTLFNNAETFDELGKGLWENVTVGSVVGNMMGGGLAAVSSVGARQRLTDKEFRVFEKIVGDGSLQRDFESQVSADLASGKIDRVQYDKLIDNLQTAKSVIEQIPENLSVGATREAFDLLEEKAKLKKKDPALVGDRIKQIDNRLAEISKMRQEAPKPVPAPEAKVAETTTPATPTKLELEAQKAEIEDRRAEELERVNIAVAEASETGTSPELDGRAINPEQEINSINAKYDAEVAALTQPKPTTDAVQERTTKEVGAQPVGTEGAGQEGRGGVGPGVQGPEAPQAGGPQGQVTPTAEGPVRPEAPPIPKADIVKKMKDLDKIEEDASSRAKKLYTPAQKALEEMVVSDPRLERVKRDNFAKAVADLEKSGKIKVRCP